METYLYNQHNKVPLIEYNFLINLILKNKNIDLSISKYITVYLKPIICKYEIHTFLDKNAFFEKINIYDFFSKYNLKYKIFNKLISTYNLNFLSNKLYCSNYLNVTISYRRYKKDNDIYFYDISYSFEILYFLEITYFKFNLYSNNFNSYLKINKFNDFDKSCILLYNNNIGLLMDDYMFSSPIKKYLYYYLFKKCLLPFIKYIYHLSQVN